MIFKQFYLSCLAHASYLIGDEGEAVVIDPQRDVDFYIEEAAQAGLKICHIIETHLHADFVSGHIELAKKTGAKIYFGHLANAQFEHTPVQEGNSIRVGKLTFTFLETPGHTPESICVLLKAPGEPLKLFTGDTLFIGEVGRPDLVGSKGYTADQMATMLFHSLHQKILPLPNNTEIYPAHGAGSACGKNISDERTSTLGMQKKTNYALQSNDVDQFVKLVTSNLPSPPSYFPVDAELNRKGALPLHELRLIPNLTPQQIAYEINLGSTVLDVRNAAEFGEGHIPNSLNIQLIGSFAPWVGNLLKPQNSIVLVGEEEQIHEARVRLARVGFENVKGYLKGGVLSWKNAGFALIQLKQTTVAHLNELLHKKGLVQVLDVRKPSEFQGGHVPGAINIPLDELAQKNDSALNSKIPTAVICASGYRSTIAASLLEQKGFENLENIVGGTAAWKDAHFEMEM